LSLHFFFFAIKATILLLLALNLLRPFLLNLLLYSKSTYYTLKTRYVCLFLGLKANLIVNLFIEMFYDIVNIVIINMFHDIVNIGKKISRSVPNIAPKMSYVRYHSLSLISLICDILISHLAYWLFSILLKNLKHIQIDQLDLLL